MMTDHVIKTAFALESQIAQVIVGQKQVVRETLIALLAGGHVLLEGVPGLGKTALVKALAQATGLRFARIQFTPDLMPADVVGTTLVGEDRRFTYQEGPIFAELVLADEINRATPKTQSALLEAMQERQVTAGGATRPLPQPFFVLATQNPVEQEGTYPLPEAQLDRFLFKILVPYPTKAELKEIAQLTLGTTTPKAEAVVDGPGLLQLIETAKAVPVAEVVLDYAADLILKTQPESATAPESVQRYLRYGASPRGLQALISGGRVRALLEGRYHVAIEDIKAIAAPALRHRLGLNFEGQAAGIQTDDLVRELVEQ